MKFRTAICLLALTLLPWATVSAGSPGPQTEIRILCFGDSLTAGYELDREEAWPARLEQLARAEGWPVRTINSGVSGDTTASGLTRLEWNLQQPAEVFLLALGANDGLRGLPLEQSRENLLAILERVREFQPDMRLAVAGMRLPRNYGLEYADEFQSIFPAIAERHQAMLIPFLLEGVGGVPELNLPDGIHPNSEGQEVVARLVWSHLKPWLRTQFPELTPG